MNPEPSSAAAADSAATLEIDIDKKLVGRHRTFELVLRFSSTARRIVVHGPSGSGKSIMLQSIAGLLRPDRGRITLCGQVLFDSERRIDLSAQERRIGYLFQDYALFPHLTVRQNVRFGLARSLFNPLASRCDPESDRWLAALGIADLAQQYPWQLSGGQRQRAALARALIRTPRALLLDEPFAALDPRLRTRLRDELDELQARLAIPMVMVSHDPVDIERFGDDTLEIHEGREFAGNTDAVARERSAAVTVD